MPTVEQLGFQGENKNEIDKEKMLIDLENRAENFRQTDEYISWLDAMSRFHKYSAGNVWLIMLQAPEATRAAGYKRWLNELGYQVRKGEKAIRILAPRVVKYEDADGEEQVFIKGFHSVPVFGDNQVDPIEGKAKPLDLDMAIGTDADDISRAAWDLASSTGGIMWADDCGAARGYYNPTNGEIGLNPLLRSDHSYGSADIARVTVHELAHRFYCEKIDHDEGWKYDYQRGEWIAESVAYIVMKRLGVESQASEKYLGAWNVERGDLQGVMNDVRTVSDMIIEEMEI